MSNFFKRFKNTPPLDLRKSSLIKSTPHPTTLHKYILFLIFLTEKISRNNDCLKTFLKVNNQLINQILFISAETLINHYFKW